MASQRSPAAGAKPVSEGRVKRRSKMRTQVSDTSSSDESSDTSDTSSASADSSPDEDDEGASSADKEDLPDASDSGRAARDESEDSESEASGRPNPGRNVQDDFSAFYRRSIASELAEDLDKVRSANDFNEGKMPMLIRALKQGEVIFSEEEKKTVMQGSKD